MKAVKAMKAMKTKPDAMKTKPNAMKAKPKAMKTKPNAMKAKPNAMKAKPKAMKAMKVKPTFCPFLFDSALVDGPVFQQEEMIRRVQVALSKMRDTPWLGPGNESLILVGALLETGVALSLNRYSAVP
jgi:hypothetical protein